MSNLSMVEATLPPGFRFHPRDEELVFDYLLKKVSRSDHLQSPLLIEVDLNKCEPWELPEMASVGGKEWYFYSQRDRKYATGLRTNRATVSGYWKATGKDRSVVRKRILVGMRKTLVFYQGRAPRGKKTDWVMHEFRLEGPLCPSKASSAKEDWVLCRVFCKNRENFGAKQGLGSSCGFEDTISSSSLPPLMDPYCYSSLTFDQSQLADDNQFEQVPCFSIFNNNNTSFLHMLSASNDFDCINIPNLLSSSCTKIDTTTGGDSTPLKFGGGDTTSTHDQGLNIPSSSSSYSCEKKDAIKAVLSHFNKMDHQNNMKDSPLSFGEGISDQSFLSDADLPATMWYP